MKKGILTLIFFGLIAWVSIANQVPDNHTDDGKNSVTLVKGVVEDSNNDGIYDYLDFGLTNLGSGILKLAKIISCDGRTLGVIHDFSRKSIGSTTWFSIDLTNQFTPDEFYLEVHIKVKKGGLVSWAMEETFLRSLPGAPLPNDPDETILIVKYP